jgi:hypothetical protein
MVLDARRIEESWGELWQPHLTVGPFNLFRNEIQAIVISQVDKGCLHRGGAAAMEFSKESSSAHFP